MSQRHLPERVVDVSPTELIDPPIDELQEESVGDEVRKTVSALMPWGVSIFAHLGLVVLAFFLVWQTIERQEEKPTVPTLATTPDAYAMTQHDVMEQQPDSSSSMITPVIDVITPPKPVVIGFDKPIVAIPNIADVGNGIDDGVVDQGGDGDGIFCLLPPHKPGGAKKVVFVIDASGSMVDVLPFVIDELKRTINKQNKDLQATILMFSGDGVFEVPGGGAVKGLRPLTPAFKQQITEWVTLKNHRFETGGPGSRHVLAAIDRALSYHPEAVFLLSDNLTGGGQGATTHELFQSEVMKVVRSHSQTRQINTLPARINTIQFLYEDPLVRIGLPGTLQLIADETGGTFRFISQRDLNLR